MRRSILLALALSSSAHAGTVLVYEETFDTNLANFSGTDGWVSGYTGDNWTTQGYGGVAPKTNDNIPNGWDSNSYTDNHLVQTGELFTDFQLDVSARSLDDDTMGVVFRYQGSGDFYVAMFTRNALPSYPQGGIAWDDEGAFLYKVQNGSASEIAANQGLGFTYVQNAWTTIRVIATGSQLDVYLDRNADGLFAFNELMLSVNDASFAMGRVGVYSYSNEAEFDDFRVYLFDDDDDGVANEDDNCPADANDDQADLDGDLIGDVCDDDADGDGTVAGLDCDDLDAAVFPGAPEVCNDIDDDCNGTPDDNAVDSPAWYLDADGDGHGGLVATKACDAPADHVAASDDCDDAEPAVYTGADELCDGLDNDCDLTTDEDAVDAPTWYLDDDGDGFGDAGAPLARCTQPPGYVADGTDCNDARPTVYPGADEYCNGRDDDCDTRTDESDAVDPSTWFADADGDGFGDPLATVDACDAPPGHVADATDCDDTDDTENPAAFEICDGDDDDCDGTADEPDAVDAPTWYADTDNDGFGDLSSPTAACTAPTGHVADASDCDDSDNLVKPGAVEQCNGVDDDCDNTIDDGVVYVDWYPDADNDGFGDPAGATVNDCAQPVGYTYDDSDCDDSRADAYPGAPETCNGLDDDCDTVADEDAIDAGSWYADADADGYGVGEAVVACDPPPDHASADGDCDDAVASTFPGAVEQCNEIDDDCDSAVDEDVVDSSWYTDADGDGYGDPATEIVDCLQPPETVADGTDCDDDDPAVNPGAEEIAGNGVDDDCAGGDDVPGTDTDTDTDGGRVYDPEEPQQAAVTESGGCGCATPGSAPAGAWVLLLGLVGLRRRR